jgi:hypothetical protein
MALTKVNYVDGVTTIMAKNLNDIQDEVIANGTAIATQAEQISSKASASALTAEATARAEADAALDNELDDVKSNFETFTGEQQLTGWRSDYPYLTNTTEPVNFEPVNRNTAYTGLAVECSPGDVFTITVSASNSAYRAYAWLDADKYVIYKTPNNQTFDRTVITAPAGAAYLAINSLKSYNPSASKGQSRLDALENNIVGFPIFSLYSTLGVIGDSWASGGVTASNDDFPHSWPQIVGRCYGVDATNFSHVGLTAKSWLASSYGLSKLQNDDAKGLYICALGINDSAHPTTNPVGAVEDIETGADTFYGNYGKIIKAIQAKAPTAKICISTIPQYNPTANISGYNTAIENIASHFSIQLLVVADDKFFNSSYFVDNLADNHPPLPVYAGIAEAYNRMISAACISNAAYWNA